MKIRPITEKQKEKLKTVLMSEKEKLIFKDIYLSEDFNLTSEDRSDEIDQANSDVSNSLRLRFRNRENFYVKKLDKALKRIEDGIYDECDECGENIGFSRLNARPTAELCIHCKEESEKVESGSILGRKSKSLGKALSLVKQI